MRIEFTLTGTQPLLMHHDNIDGCDEVKEWQTDPKNKNVSKAGDDRSPAWTWHSYCYNDGENLVVPSANLMACLKSAGARKTLKKTMTYKEITQTGILIPTEYLRFENNGKQVSWREIEAIRDKPFKEQVDLVKEMGFTLFMKRAGIGKSKHVRVRPRFENWTLHGKAEITAQELTFDVLLEIFSLAGPLGLCDWRPGCKTPGPFGQFEVKLKKK